jgi:MFS family permease
MGIACIWLAVASEKTYPVFVLARAFLGLWEAPIEAIVPSTVADIFFLHERGEKISIYGLSVLGGNEIGPLVSAYVIQSLSMRWAFFIVAICISVNMITMVLFMPETKFTGHRPVLVTLENNLSIRGDQKSGGSEHREDLVVDLRKDIIEEERSGSPKKKTFIQELAYCSTTDSQVNLFKIFLRPFVLMAFPTVLWASALYGMSLSWNLILGATVAQLFGVE